MKNLYDITEKTSTAEQSSYITPVFTGLEKSYARLKRKSINLLISENYAQLLQELALHTEQEIKSFFIAEGHSLLKQAILASGIRPLDFIVKNIPFEAVQIVFNNDKTNFLEDFLYAQKMSELKGQSNQSDRDLMIEKFILFFKIDPEGIQAFMNEYASNKDYVTASIKEDYQAALKIFQDEKKEILRP